MLLKHYLGQGEQERARHRLGVSRDTIHRWICDGELERDLDAVPVRYGPPRPVPTKLGTYKASWSAPGGVAAALSGATARGESRGGLYGWLHAAESCQFSATPRNRLLVVRSARKSRRRL